MRLHWKIESHRLKLQLKKSFSTSAIVSNLMLCSPLWLSIHTRIKVLIGPGRKQRLNKWTSAKLWVTCRPAPITGQFLRGHLTKARELTGLNMWCPRRSWGSAGPQASAAPSAPGSPTSSSYTDSELLPLCSPRQHAHRCVQLGPQERGLCQGLYHCGRRFFILLAVINACILSLHPADFQGEICAWPTATEPVWDPRGPVGSPIDQELWRLAWFLQVPIQIILSISV